MKIILIVIMLINYLFANTTDENNSEKEALCMCRMIAINSAHPLGEDVICFLDYGDLVNEEIVNETYDYFDKYCFGIKKAKD